MATITDYTDPVVVERMPEYLRGSHRAAGNWGRYPHNGAERVIVERADTERWYIQYDEDNNEVESSIESDEYDHVVRSATPEDFERYESE